MADNSQGSFFSSVTPQQMLAILTLLGSMVLLQFPPLQSRREIEQIASASVPNDDHFFHASNIEDPLGALAAQKIVHPEDEEKFDPNTQVQAFTHWGFYRHQLHPRFFPPGSPAAPAASPGVTAIPPIPSAAPASQAPVLLVFAYLRSGEDVPSKEQRLRDRLAVVYALHNSGYVPEKERSLECLLLKAPTQKMLNSGMLERWNPDYNDKAATHIPFEWFRPIPGQRANLNPTDTKAAGSDYQAVCVLWVDSEVFAKMQKTEDTPLDCLRSVIYNLTTGRPRPRLFPPQAVQPPESQPLPQPYLLPQLQLFPQLQLTFQPQLLKPLAAAQPPKADPPDEPPPFFDKDGKRHREIPLDKIKIGLLGPPSSDMLTKFIAEAGKLAEAAQPAEAAKPAPMTSKMRWRGPIQMSSPYATASAQALLRLADPGKKEDTTCRALCELDVQERMNLALAGNFPTAQSLYLSVPCSDDYVARALIEEMQVRGITFHEKTGNLQVAGQDGDIVLISEFDTSYGRELPFTLYSAAREQAAATAAARASPSATGSKKSPAHKEITVQTLPPLLENDEDNYWHWSSYTQGLDGRFAAAKPKESNLGGGSAHAADKKTLDEEPRGITETDALRRLAQQLQHLHERRQRNNKPGIVAVGVLGGDVYDQLLVLRALRPSFPHALFFCNNLDAWLWDPDELPTTRNLVVASPFGLYLPEQWQRGKPPFRNAYQTAVFAGTLALASKNPYLSPPPPKHVFSYYDQLPEKQKVHHYEISPDGPVDLDCQDHELRTFWSPKSRKAFLRLLICILAASWLFWLITSNRPFIRYLRLQFVDLKNISQTAAEFRAWAQDSFGRLLANPTWVFIILLLVPVFVLEAWKYTAKEAAPPAPPAATITAAPAATPPTTSPADSPPTTQPEPVLATKMSGIEPLDFTSGISAWPCIALNFAAALLACHLMLKALYLLWRGERHLQATYFPHQAPSATLRRTWEYALLIAAAICRHAPHLRRIRAAIHNLHLGSHLRTRLQHHRTQLSTYTSHARAGLLVAWNVPQIITDTKRDVQHTHGKNKDLDPRELWQAYQLSSNIGARLIRSAVVALVIGWVAIEMSHILPEPGFAIRGEKTRQIATWTESAGLAAFIWLGTLVFDTLWLNRIFIYWFGKGQSLWPQDIVKSFFATDTFPEAHCDYIDLRLIEDWTREIGRLTALPFYVLVCLCLARLGWFDQTPCPWHVIAILVFIIALVILGALRVHHTAEILRAKALRSLDCKSTGQMESPEAEKISQLIKGISGGAFMSFWRQPVMEAVYWLVSALSLTGLWQTISRFVP